MDTSTGTVTMNVNFSLSESGPLERIDPSELPKPLKDKYWASDIEVNVTVLTNQATAEIKLISPYDPERNTPGLYYSAEYGSFEDNLIQVDYEINKDNHQPKLIFRPLAQVPEGSCLSQEQYSKLIDYFQNSLKPRIADYFNSLIISIENFIKSKTNEEIIIKHWS